MFWYCLKAYMTFKRPLGGGGVLLSSWREGGAA
jgi:hypothetical protein